MLTMYNFATMFRFKVHIKRLTLLLLFFQLSTAAVWGQTDSVAPRRNIVQRLIDYFANANEPIVDNRLHVSFVGGPFYSTDTKFGVGLVAAGLYRVDSVTPVSNVSLKGQLSTSLFYSVGITGDHIFSDDHMRIGYDVDFKSFPTYFWGIGYDEAIDDMRKAKYTNISVNLDGDLKLQLLPRFFVGPAVSFAYNKATDIEQPALWYGLPVHTTAFGLGATLQYDSRDAIGEPHSGWYVKVNQTFYPRCLGNSTHSYSITSAHVSHYREVWRGGVIAGCLQGKFTYGHTPWTMLPTLGGSSTMRGYFSGQYRDKCAADFTIELRQHVYRRSGVVVWGGVGTIFPDFSSVRWKHLLPNAGVGYRWEFKHRVNVRVDVGFGRDTWGVEFNINEAF